MLSVLAFKQDAAVTGVLDGPLAVGGKEGEGEVGGEGERMGGGRGGVRRQSRMEPVEGKEAEKWRHVEAAEAAEE